MVVYSKYKIENMKEIKSDKTNREKIRSKEIKKDQKEK
jgi:hypothetical protein